MASGDHLMTFSPRPQAYPTSNAATPGRRAGRWPCLEFADDADQEAHFTAHMPGNYAGGSITFDVDWITASVTSGNAVFGIAVERGTTDLDSDGLASEQTIAGACSGTSGIPATTSITLTQSQADSVAAGEPFRVRLRRLASTDANDTIEELVQVLSLTMREA